MTNNFGQGSATYIAGFTQGDDEVIAHLCAATGLDAHDAQELFTGIWFTTHGIASLLATNNCTINHDEITKILRHTYIGLIYSMKNKGADL